jgi:hypothetical protein
MISEARPEDSTPPICWIEPTPRNLSQLEEGNSDAFPAIMCSDLPPMNGTVDEFVEFAQELGEISESAGDINALFRLACIGRTVRPKWRFDGMCQSWRAAISATRLEC